MAHQGSLKALAAGIASAAMLVAVSLSQTGCAVSAPVPAVPPAPPPAAPAPASVPPLPEKFADDVEIRITQLHHELRIQPSQEALFDAYADTMRSNAHTIHMLFVERIKAADFSAPARLRWYGQLSAAHAEAVNRLVAPLEALYQSLTPEQKVLADRHFEQLRQRRMPHRKS